MGAFFCWFTNKLKKEGVFCRGGKRGYPCYEGRDIAISYGERSDLENIKQYTEQEQPDL